MTKSLCKASTDLILIRIARHLTLEQLMPDWRIGRFLVAVVAVLIARTAWSRPLAQEPAAHQDSYGDPLPKGAVARLGTIRLRHGATVTSVALSPDGKLLASTGEDAALRVWDTATGRQRWAFHSHVLRIGQVCFSPNGAVLAAAIGQHLEQFDALSGASLPRLASHPAPISSIRYAPSGRLVLTVSNCYQGTVAIQVTEVATGKQLLRRLPDPAGFVLSGPRVAFTADEQMVLMNTSDESIEAWKVDGLAPVYTLKDDGAIGQGWQLSADGTSLLTTTGDDENRVEVWDLVTGKRRFRLCAGGRRSPLLTPDSKRLLLTGMSEPALEYDLATGKLLHTFDQAKQECVAISPDGKVVALTPPDPDAHPGSQTVRLQQLKAPNLVDKFSAAEFLHGIDRNRRFSFSPDGRALALMRDAEAT